MIGSSSARIEERLTDGVVIVVEVFREPLLGHGLLGELDISLRDVVVVMFVICERVVLGKGTKVLIGGSAQGATNEVDGQKEGQGDKREDGEEGEGSGVVEERAIRHNDHNAHEAWM